jgi:hypothetical protein
VNGVKKMRRRSKFQRDLNKLVRRTDIRSEQIYDKVKDFVETTDELADRICYTLRKVLSTTDDTADVLYETMQRILGTDHTLRNRLAGLLELEDLSEEDLEFEIRRFLDAAASRRAEGPEFSTQERTGRDFRKSEERVSHFAEGKSDGLIIRLQEMLDSRELSSDEFKEKTRDLLHSMKAGVESAAEKAESVVTETSNDLRIQLKRLTGNERLSEEQLKKRLGELIGAFSADTRTENPQRPRTHNRKMAKTLHS